VPENGQEYFYILYKINLVEIMKKKTFLIMALAVIFIFSSLTPVSQAEEKQKRNVNNITQDALQAGIRTCANRINQISNFLTAGISGIGHVMFIPSNNSDRQMASVSMEIPLKTGTAYASATFAPECGSNNCAGMYETVFYWPEKCASVAEKQFGAFKKAGALSKNIYVRDDGKSTKVFLMPAGTGCVTIKKEIIR